MYKALIIGCGNIGGMYDLESDEIITHAKAFSNRPEIELYVFDTDAQKTQLLHEKYQAIPLDVIDEAHLKQFDIVSLCVPTHAHFDYLKRILHVNIPLLICEKPLVSTLEEIAFLESVESETFILVNYIRRFLPGFKKTKEYLQHVLQTQRLIQIVIKYQKGFSNNGSHALDLISYLTNRSISFDQFERVSQTSDFFENDPTMTCHFKSNGVAISMVGLTEINYAVFEIELFLSSGKISILNRGDDILSYRLENKQLVLDETHSHNHVLTNYMEHVIAEALLFFENKTESNFKEALKLNKDIIQQLMT